MYHVQWIFYQVEQTGIHLHEDYLWIGCSPDGVVEDGSLLEIKCPWGLRDQSIGHYISAFQDQKLYGEASSVMPKLAFLTADRENVLLNPNHVYYHQIQTQLHCTGKYCYTIPGPTSLNFSQYSSQY